LKHRLHFHRPDGTRCLANSGAPVCSVAFGEANVESLRQSGLVGILAENWTSVGGRIEGVA
jgi:hypothetical protein